jgi:hypothetical protein
LSLSLFFIDFAPSIAGVKRDQSYKLIFPVIEEIISVFALSILNPLICGWLAPEIKNFSVALRFLM